MSTSAPTETPAPGSVIREDATHWFTSCLGGCDVTHATGKRTGRPVDYMAPEKGIIWTPRESAEPKMCASCGIDRKVHPQHV